MKKLAQTLFEKKKKAKKDKKDKKDKTNTKQKENNDNAKAVVIESPHDGEDVLAVLVLSDGTILSSGSGKKGDEKQQQQQQQQQLLDKNKKNKNVRSSDIVDQDSTIEKGCLKRWTTNGQLLQSVLAPTLVYSLVEIISEHDVTSKLFVSCSTRSIDVWMIVDLTKNRRGHIRHLKTVGTPNLTRIVPIQQLPFRVGHHNSSSTDCHRYFMTQSDECEGVSFWRASLNASKGFTVTKLGDHYISVINTIYEFDGCQLSDGRVCVLLREYYYSELLTLGEDSESITLMEICKGMTEVDPVGIVATCVAVGADRGYIAFYEVTSGLRVREFPVVDICQGSNKWFIRSVDQSFVCTTSKSDSPLTMRLWDTQSADDLLQLNCINSSNQENEPLNNFYVGCSASGIRPNVDRSSSSNSSPYNEHLLVFGEGVQMMRQRAPDHKWKSRLVIARVTLPQSRNSTTEKKTTNSKSDRSISSMFNNGKAHYSAVRAVLRRPLDGTILSVSSDCSARLWSSSGTFIKRISTPSSSVWSILPLNDDHSVYSVLFGNQQNASIMRWNFSSVDHSVPISDFLRFPVPNETITLPMHWLKSRRLLALCDSSNRLNLWDIQNSPSTLVRSFVDQDQIDQIRVCSVCSVESRDMIVGGGSTGVIKVWNIDTSQLLFTLTADPTPFAVLLHAGEGKVASYQTNGCVSIFDLTIERKLRSWTHTEEENQYSNKFERPFCMVLLSGNQLCTSRNNTIRIWDLKGRCHFCATIPVSGIFCDISCMVERPDRSIVLGFTSGRVTLFRPPTRFYSLSLCFK